MFEDLEKIPYKKSSYDDFFWLKFNSYVIFLLVSRYYSLYLSERMQMTQSIREKSEREWTQILEYVQPDFDRNKRRIQAKIEEQKENDMSPVKIDERYGYDELNTFWNGL